MDDLVKDLLTHVDGLRGLLDGDAGPGDGTARDGLRARLAVLEDDVRATGESLAVDAADLAARARRTGRLFSDVPAAMVVTREDGVVVQANEAARRLWLSAAPGRPVFVRLPAGQRAEARRLLAEAAARGAAERRLAADGLGVDPPGGEASTGGADGAAGSSDAVVVRVIRLPGAEQRYLWTAWEPVEQVRRRLAAALARTAHPDAYPEADPERAEAELARLALGRLDRDDALRRLADVALRAVPAAEEVGVVLRDDGPDVLDGWATTGPRLDALLRAEHRSDEGPAHDVVRSGAPLLVCDVRADGRWPGLADLDGDGEQLPLLVEPLRTPVDEQSGGPGDDAHDAGRDRSPTGAAVLGALVVLPTRGSEKVVVHAEVREVTTLLAAAASTTAVLAERAQLGDQLRRALESRTVLEQAKGVLVARQGVDPDAAFALLHRQARSTGRRLQDVALAVVRDAARARR